MREKNNINKNFATMDNMVKNFTDDVFERVWKKLVRNYGTDIRLVKKNFVKSMIELVSKAVNFNLQQQDLRQLVFDHDFILCHATIENEIEAIFYYHLFYTKRLSENERANLAKDKNYQERLAYEVGQSIVFRINDHKIRQETSELSPEIVACRQVCNDMIRIIGEKAKKDIDSIAGVLEVFSNAATTAKSVLVLLSKGLTREALILWRNLHEQDCLLRILTQYGNDAAKPFMKHSHFMDIENSEVEDILIKELEQINKEYKIKVSRRDYINYGWLLYIADFKKDFVNKKYNLSFTGGLQKFALRDSDERDKGWYAYASKFTHPTFYSIRILKADAFRSCITFLMLSISNISCIFNKLCEANNFFSDEKIKIHFGYSIENFNEKMKILHENLRIHREE